MRTHWNATPAILVLALSVAGSAAKADCTIVSPPLMYLGGSASYDLALEMNRADHCSIDFNARGEGVYFHSLSIDKAPSGGVLRKVSGFAYDFAPKSDASTDSFTLKLCGRDIKGQGCNLLRYRAQIR